MSNFKSASGYAGDRALAPLRKTNYHKKILDYGWPEDNLTMLCNTTVLSELTRCGDTIQFATPAMPTPWRRNESNQERIYDQPAIGSFCVQICHDAYKAFKIDDLQIRLACDNWAQFESSMLEGAYNMLSLQWQTDVLTGMITEAMPGNKGARAGVKKNINLGTLDVPIKLNKDNLLGFLQRLRMVLAQRYRWKQGEMVLQVPFEFEPLVAETQYASQLCCNTQETVLVKGLMMNNLYGFKVISNNILPEYNGAAGPVHYITASWQDAYAFAGEVISASVIDGSTNPSADATVYKMRAIWGNAAIYPDAIAVAVVQLPSMGV